MPVTFDSDPSSPEYLENFYRRAENAPWRLRGEEFLSDPANKFRLFLIADEIRRLKPKRLLDVGCGSAALADLVADEQDIEYAGCDLAAPEGSEGGVRFVAADAANLPFESGSFDAAVCSEVLEHLREPAAALNEIARILSPGASALITVPNWFSLDSLDGSTGILSGVAGLLGRAGVAPAFKFGVNVHLTKKFPSGWMRLIEENGFVIEHERPVFLFPYIPYLFKRMKKIESEIFGSTDRFNKWMRFEESLSSRFPFSRLGQFHYFRCKKR